MTQNEAVFQAVSSVFGNDGELDGAVPETGKWSDKQKADVLGLMMQSFKAGEWTKNSGGQDDAALLKYIPGLVNNHVRKDKRLNGNVEYKAKNPGSRAGTGDESIKAMRTLLSMTTDEKREASHPSGDRQADRVDQAEGRAQRRRSARVAAASRSEVVTPTTTVQLLGASMGPAADTATPRERGQ